MNIKREKPHVVAILCKWYSANPLLGPHNTTWGLESSLDTSDTFTHDKIYLDEWVNNTKRRVDDILIDICRIKRPDVLFTIWIPDYWQDLSYELGNCRLETFQTIRSEIGTKIVLALTDTYQEVGFSNAEKLSKFADLVVALDTTRFERDSSRPERYIHVLEPMDPRIFNNPGINRDINVSFIGCAGLSGTIEAYSERRRILEYVKANEEILITGGRKYTASQQKDEICSAQDLTISDFANLMQRSKISLNIAVANDGRVPVRARTMQVKLCGALTIEEEGADLCNWFTPYKDFVPYSSAEDLVDKIKYYLAHEEERVEIANHGCQTATRNHTGKAFWESIFNKLKQVPPLSPEDIEKAVAVDLKDVNAFHKALPYFQKLALRHGHYLPELVSLLRNLEMKEEATSANLKAWELDENPEWFPHLINIIDDISTNNKKVLDLLNRLTSRVEMPTKEVSLQFVPETALKPQSLTPSPWTQGFIAFSHIIRCFEYLRRGEKDITINAALKIFINDNHCCFSTHITNLAHFVFTKSETYAEYALFIVEFSVEILRQENLLSSKEFVPIILFLLKHQALELAHKYATEALSIAEGDTLAINMIQELFKNKLSAPQESQPETNEG